MVDRSTRKGWKLVFEDNFDCSEVGENWKVLKGDWQVEKGKLLGNEASVGVAEDNHFLAGMARG